jgi:ribosomal protein S27AE
MPKQTGDKYTDDLLSIIDYARYEYDPECGGGLADHVISSDPLGNPHMWCTLEGGEPRREEIAGNPVDNAYIDAAEAAVMLISESGCPVCGRSVMAGHSLRPGDDDGYPVIVCLGAV